MKFQVGDRVLVMHSEEEGEVVDVINDKMVMVEVKGVKFPAYVDQLEFPYFKRFSEKKPPQTPKKHRQFIEDLPKEKGASASSNESGLWLVFLPVTDTDEFGDEIVEELKIHLINRSSQTFSFDYALEYFGKPGFELSNRIEPRQDFYLHDMPFENLNDGPAFSVVFRLAPPQKGKAESFETSLKLKAKQVFGRIEEIRQKGEATFSYRLMDRYPDKLPDDRIEFSSLSNKGFKVYSASSARQHLEPAKQVLDLHIEKLTGDFSALSNFEMLSLQLQTLEKYLDLAVSHHQVSMIAIHGVGKGKLRDEIHEILRLRRDVKSFINRYHPAYGYGATEIFFQY